MSTNVEGQFVSPNDTKPTVSSSSITEGEMEQAALEDYRKQTKWDNSYDRQKGFIEGVKWAIKQMKNCS